MSKILKSISMRQSPRIVNAMPAPLPARPIVVTEIREVAPVDNKQAQLEVQNLLLEAQAQAAAVLDTAEVAAKELLDAAEQDGKIICSQARDDGFQQGYEEGLGQGRAAAEQAMQLEMAGIAEKSQQIITLAQNEAAGYIGAAEGKIVELAIALAQKILAHELSADTGATAIAIAKKALEKVRDQEQLTIRVNAADYQVVLENRRDLQMILGQEQALTIAHDETVEAGSCVIEGANGMVDARISTQFEVLKKMLQDIIS